MALALRREWAGATIVAALAFAWTAGQARAALDGRWPASANGTDVAVTGWVDSFPSVEPARTVFSLRVETAATQVPIRRLRLSWYDAPARIEPGMALELQVRLRAPHGLANPAGFDYERWLFLERYGATGYVRSGAVNGDRQYGLAQRWLGFRARISRRLSARVREPDAAALLSALSLGERSGFSDHHWAVLQRTGTSHLVAVSGLHIGLIATLTFVIAVRIALRLPYALARRAHALAALVSVVVASLYAALAGFTLPTQRALAMLIVAQILIVARRRRPIANGLGSALLLVLVLDPLASLTASFWLSFGAVAVLLISIREPAHPMRAWAEAEPRAGTTCGGRAGPAPRRRSWLRCRHHIAAFTRLQLALTLALMPLVVWFFGQLSLASLIVNLVAIPLFSLFVVPLSLLAALCAALDISGFGVMRLAGASAEAAWRLLELAASPQWSAIELGRPSIWALGTSLVAAAMLLPRIPLPGRLLAMVGFAPLFLARGSAVDVGQARVTVLDVGQGLAVAIETASHRLLYDAGPVYRSGFDAGAEVVAPALSVIGGEPLDLLILSHGDSDHAGGAAAVAARHPSARMLVGPDVPGRISSLSGAETCRAGESWRWDGVRFSILHPPDGFLPLGNESSCVLAVATDTAIVLLTGDIESRAERGLVARGLPQADVVVVPHHGSATSSTRAFVEAAGADLAVVSAGYDNQWGFPRDEVRARWQSSGAELLVTADQGAITIALEAGGWRVATERTRRRRYWQPNVMPVPGAIDATAL